MPEPALPERELTFAQAVREALAEEMRRDSRVCIFGEDVAEAGTPFKVLSGLVEEFGAERVLDTPISEAGFTGVGVGAAMTGLRPVVDIRFGDFLTLTMDQMVNQAAKAHYMSGGHWKVPMVMRTTLGATRRSAAQHSQSLQAWFSHVPGLKVVLPSTPYDAKGLLKTAIRDENPVVFFEDKMMYKLKGPVPAEDYTIPLGVADVKRVGEDITFVATSSMVQVALGAANMLEKEGISAEVVDPRTTWPLDEKTIIESAKKTSRVIVLDEGYGRYGVTAELAAVIAEGAFYDLDAPVKRMGAMQCPHSVFSAARRCDRADGRNSFGSSAPNVQQIVTPASCRLSRGRLALGGRDARETAALQGADLWDSRLTEPWRWIGRTGLISTGCAASVCKKRRSAGQVVDGLIAMLRHEQRALPDVDPHRHLGARQGQPLHTAAAK